MRGVLIEILGHQMIGEQFGAEIYGAKLELMPSLKLKYQFSLIVHQEIQHAMALASLLEQLGEDAAEVHARFGGREAANVRMVRMLADETDWIGVGVGGALLTDGTGAAFIGAGVETVWPPMREAFKRMIKDEDFHVNFGEQCLKLAVQAPVGAARAQEVVDRYFAGSLNTLGRAGSKRDLRYRELGIRVKTVDEVRQDYVDLVRARIEPHGLRLPPEETW